MPQANPKPNEATGRAQRKVRQGVVVSDAMDKSVVVRVERTTKHPLYKKVVRQRKRYMAHDEKNDCNVGDVVRIAECRPMSRRKRWRVMEIVSKGQV